MCQKLGVHGEHIGKGVEHSEIGPDGLDYVSEGSVVLSGSCHF